VRVGVLTGHGHPTLLSSLSHAQMLELHRKGELTQQTQYNVSDEWLSASLDRCRQPGQETGNYIICSKDLLGMGPVRALYP